MLPPRFLFTTLVAVAGASLLYGFNTSVVNTPAVNIQNWYAKCYAQRAGLWPVSSSSESSSNETNSTSANVTSSQATSTAIPQVVNISVLWSVTTSIYFLAGMISAFCFGKIADKIGRKVTLLCNNALSILAAVCFLVCYPICSPELLIIGRFIVGLNCGVGLGLCPLYLSELATKSLRGPVTASSYLGCSIGLLLAQVFGLSAVLGSPTTWTYCLALTAIPSIVQLCLLPLCPESPRFLYLTKKDPEAARKAYIWLYGKEEGEAEFERLNQEFKRRSVISMHKLASLASMKNVMSSKSMQEITSALAVQAKASGVDLTKMAAEVDLDKPTKPSEPNVKAVAKRRQAKKSVTKAPASEAATGATVPLKLFFTDRQYALPLFIGIVCHIAQQWSGINAVFTYSGTIFKGIGLPSNVTQYCTLATGGSSVVSVACCIPLFSKLGRRTLVLSAVIIMSSGLLLLVICGATGVYANEMNYVGIAAVIIFIFGYAPIGTTPPVLVSEMFLQNARGMAFSVAIAVRWGSNIIILFAFPYMIAAMGPYTFLVFLGCLLACLAGLALYLPETKGKPLMEIHDMVSHGFDHIVLHTHSVDLEHIAYHLHLPYHKHHHGQTDGTQTDDDVENGTRPGVTSSDKAAPANTLSTPSLANMNSGLELHKINTRGGNLSAVSLNGTANNNSNSGVAINGSARANKDADVAPTNSPIPEESPVNTPDNDPRKFSQVSAGPTLAVDAQAGPAEASGTEPV